MQIILVLAEGILDLTTNGFHAKECERDEAHQGNCEPTQHGQEGEWEG
jgi:hypothetical protein